VTRIIHLHFGPDQRATGSPPSPEPHSNTRLPAPNDPATSLDGLHLDYQREIIGDFSEIHASSEAPVDEMSRTMHVIIGFAKLIRPAFQISCRLALRYSLADSPSEEAVGSDLAAANPDLILP